MSETIVFTVGAQVASGPTLGENRTLTFDAYDKISVAVPDGSADLEVDLPGDASSVRLLIVQSDQYGDALKYTVNATATDRLLDGPHVLVGAGAVGMLLETGPTKFLFDNALGSDAHVQILVGRDVTP